MQGSGDTLKSTALQVSGVLIQDMVVVSDVHACSFNGEFGKLDAPVEPSTKTVERLFHKIAFLAEEAKNAHLANNYNHHPRAVTRLITNEFYFYTKRPLSLSDFEQLQEKIANLMKSMPENVQLVLGTFAVEVEHKVMNVAVHMIAGKQPFIKLIVKNWNASTDPVYTNPDNGHPLMHFSVRYNSDPSKYSISVDGRKHSFSYNNVSVWKVGDTDIYTPIDICLDHLVGVGKVNTEKNLYHLGVSRFQAAKTGAPLPVASTPLCASIVISNTISIKKPTSVGSITQADPIKSRALSNPDTFNSKIVQYLPVGFGGVSICNMLHPFTCGSLPQYESKLLHYLATTGYQPIASPMREEMPTLLQLAVSNGDVAVVKDLLSLGANPVVFHRRIGSALEIAITQNLPEILAEILKYVSDNDLLQPNYHGRAPLDLMQDCAYYPEITCVFAPVIVKSRRLHHYIPYVLAIAVCLEKSEIIAFILDNAGRRYVNAHDSANNTPLKFAVERGNQDIITLLMRYRPKVDLVTQGGSSPIGMACRAGNLMTLELLLSHPEDVDINKPIEYGQTLLQTAIEGVDPVNAVEFLLHRGADPNKVSNGSTPLYSAMMIWPRNYQVIKLLFDGGATLKPPSPDLGLPLGIAIKEGDIQLVKLLLQYASPSDLYDIDVNGDMIFTLAIRSHNQEIIAELNKFDSAQRVQLEKKPVTSSVKKHGMFKDATSSNENPAPAPSQKK